jgi:hypothetical protein
VWVDAVTRPHPAPLETGQKQTMRFISRHNHDEPSRVNEVAVMVRETRSISVRARRDVWGCFFKSTYLYY